MRYCIEGFSQEAAIEFKKTISIKIKGEIKECIIFLDSVDMIILRYLMDFYCTGKMTKVETNNKEFFWLNYQKMIDALPIIRISDKIVIARRMKKLCELELLEHFTKKDKTGTWSCYRFLPAIDKLIGKNIDETTQKLDPVQPESQTPLNSKVRHNKDININKDINKNINKYADKSAFAKTSEIPIDQSECHLPKKECLKQTVEIIENIATKNKEADEFEYIGFSDNVSDVIDAIDNNPKLTKYQQKDDKAKMASEYLIRFETAFLTKIESKKDYDYGKERKHLKVIVDRVFSRDSPHIFAEKLLNGFWKMTRDVKNKFFYRMPFLPSKMRCFWHDILRVIDAPTVKDRMSEIEKIWERVEKEKNK